MSVGLILVTHDEVGACLLSTATSVLGMCPLSAELLPVRRDEDPQTLIRQATDMLGKLDQGDGVLVITDMYGSTPSNVAAELLQRGKVRVIAGLNLPMLVRVLNYPQLTLDELVVKAVEGGREGVLTWNHLDAT